VDFDRVEASSSPLETNSTNSSGDDALA